MKRILTLLLLAFTAMAQTPVPAPSVSASPSAPAAPRQEAFAAKPQCPRADKNLTVEQQGASAADRELTRKIRRAVMKNESISSMAKNVKIISACGKVTLRGPVHSEQEKAVVGSLAEEAAGKENVTNLLEVKK